MYKQRNSQTRLSLPPVLVVWTLALKIAEEELRDNKLLPLDTTKLTSDSAEENIWAVINSLNVKRLFPNSSPRVIGIVWGWLRTSGEDSG